MNSRIKSKKPIKFGKELVVSSFASANIDDYENNLRNNSPNMSEEEIKRDVWEMVKRDSFYNVVMDEVASAYEFELDDNEVAEMVSAMSSSGAEGPEIERTKRIVEIQIYKKLIYKDLERDWEIEVTDEDVKQSLENFYKSTGNSIREYLMDKNKFEEVRKAIIEQIITARLINAFKAIYQFPQQ